MKKENLTILSKENVAPRVYKMILEGESVKSMLTPGQFVHLKVGTLKHPVLRRPISICNVENNKLTIIYRIEGQGTALLNEKNIGDTVDTLGPLGEGFPLQESGKALLIGGGVGIPPLLYLAKQLKAKGVKVQAVLGFRTAEDMFLTEEFKTYADVIVTTEDGSFGIKGFVTDALPQTAPYDVFYSCGPKVMLRAVELAAATAGYISLEERMGCGVGACLACVCDKKEPFTGKSYVKACQDGPVFQTGEVVL
ncbi:dihydroorotate dehydrogenase electron transfer subunit [Alkalicoccus daliensis]|uniref:Dihydroorotate dehydrogenase B (NAD(+)), electron transfer subunit n=1 Tax=Alkalicoccus daliensis TaxID=745820 RepID=A0A1G9ZVT6_9BACI|nr:dihydroorotate dehydrogenase electron transfer subunit [Alkalicoccus daliensis]SDN25742.1 dihydroorotate dehydrogenase electron transfer subunit [Alkalicoccus daliensis]